MTATRIRAATGEWLVVPGATLTSDAEGGTDAVITIDPASQPAVTALALAASGLTRREQQVATLVLQRRPTAAICADVYLASHTFQDRLKSFFAEARVGGRRELIARVFFGQPARH